MIGRKLKQQAVKIDRLRRASEFLEHNAGVVDRVSVILAKRDGLTVSRQRFFQPGLLLQDRGAVVERFREVRFQSDRIFKGRQRLVEPTLVLQDGSQIIVNDGDPGIERNDPPIRRFGGIQLVLRCSTPPRLNWASA